ncbi:division/cell wall cluster transcriptional repressor MraZ [Aurantiacibacter spongiae]|uniref:division/cell wall cluster transcriptional repressor MraZ n=1 Tax=Aurantiacibacter spongiae TaxID=2488860 RepID=UPI001F23AB7B|nr:division/cell wall cluster transcriptional repressor MraZ [Aurantiacibacter spongiae]
MADRPSGYRGQGFSLRGEKGRYVLPPSFRKVFADNNDERVLCLAKHEKYPCLTAFGLSRTDGFEDQLDKEEESAIRRGVDFDRDLRSMQLWGFTEVPFDSSGRFILPDHLSDLGGLADAIYFQGGGQFITLWDPRRLQAMGAGFENAQAACRTMAADADAKGARGKRK